MIDPSITDNRTSEVAHFGDVLVEAVRRTRNPVLVGLDPRYEQLPLGFRVAGPATAEQQAAAYVAFCRGVIDVVAPLVPAVKPQCAFFEQLGPAGMTALAEVIRYAAKRTAGHCRRQTQRYRLDGRSLC